MTQLLSERIQEYRLQKVLEVNPDIEVEYPSDDGLPMAESDYQRTPLIYGVESLQLYFKSQPSTYVSGNLLIYPEEGNPYNNVSPDLFVVFDIGNHKRDSYKLWQEKRAPSFVLEILSKSTAGKDQGSKQGTYQYWGVGEYFLFDPKKKHLDPPLKGMRLGEDGMYDKLPVQRLADGSHTIFSEQLGLEVRVSADLELRFFDPVADRYLPNYEEANLLAQEAQNRVALLEAKLRELGIDPSAL